MLTSIGRKFSRLKNIFDAGFWIFLMIFLAAPLLVADAKQSCDIPSVHEQSATTLTCTFDEDIAVIKKSIIVLHYGESSSDEPDTVLYNALFQGEVQYFTHPGYTILGNITNTLVLKIDRVSRNHIGRYECHIMPSTPGDVEPCKFTLTDKDIDRPTTSKPADTPVLPRLSDTPEDREENLNYVKTLLIIVYIVVLLLLVGLPAAVVIYCKCTRQKPDASKGGCKVNTRTPNDSNTTQEQALLE